MGIYFLPHTLLWLQLSITEVVGIYYFSSSKYLKVPEIIKKTKIMRSPTFCLANVRVRRLWSPTSVPSDVCTSRTSLRPTFVLVPETHAKLNKSLKNLFVNAFNKVWIFVFCFFRRVIQYLISLFFLLLQFFIHSRPKRFVINIFLKAKYLKWWLLFF